VTAISLAQCAALIEDLTAIAGRAALAIQRTGAAALRRKNDGSLVTAADEAAEAVICSALEDLAPAIPIISEERWGNDPRRIPAQNGGTYFLVDPLDGTREFAAGREEFTVNIALMTDGTPILGVITAPAAGLTWRGIVGRGAERVPVSDKSAAVAIRSRARPAKPVIMVSRSHLDVRTGTYLASLPEASTAICGSSIKFCRIAEGTADLYPRLAPTHDWDVAAGHAIVTAAGGEVRAAAGSALVYGTPDRLIADFIARGDASRE
jgi:3'(2'), 5'-bisphosphate nucleotidase